MSSDDLAGPAPAAPHGPRPAWRSPPANTATPPIISAGCCEAGAVDVLQADVTRCAASPAGCRSPRCARRYHIDLSGHCAPSLHLHAACAAPRFRHLEWFHDHVRIEHMLFDGAPVPRDGMIRPDLSRPGSASR